MHYNDAHLEFNGLTINEKDAEAKQVIHEEVRKQLVQQHPDHPNHVEISEAKSIENDDTSSSNTTAWWPNEEHGKIFTHLIEHIPEWKQLIKTPDDLNLKRLNGNSNACFKVELKDHINSDGAIPRALLYRRYEQTVVDKRVEQAIFNAQSMD